MDDEIDFKKIWKIAFGKAKSKGESDESCEDFAQFVSMKFFEGRKGTIDQLLVDYFRKTYGDTRFDYGKLKSQSIRSSRDVNDTESNIESLIDHGDFEDKGKDTSKLFLKLPSRYIDCLCLLDNGFTQADIARFLRISPSRVCQIFKVIRDKKILDLGLFDDYKNGLIKDEFQINWIEI